MKRDNIQAEVFTAFKICVEITENYNDKFVAIYNNVRVSKDLLYITNDEDYNVFVYCKTEVGEKVVEWLKDAGEVKYVETVRCYEVFELEEFNENHYDGLLVLPYTEIL